MVTRVRLKSAGMRQLLNSGEIRSLVTSRAAPVLAAARASAPVRTGAYRDSLRLEQATTDRAVARVVADVDYAMVVEARTGNLARAMDAAR